MNPLQIIETWLSSLEPEIQDKIVQIIERFDEQNELIGFKKKGYTFSEYLKTNTLHNNEIIAHRSIFVILLINFAIFHNEWYNYNKKKINRDFYLHEMELNKSLAMWLIAGKKWNEFLKSYCEDKILIEWYKKENIPRGHLKKPELK